MENILFLDTDQEIERTANELAQIKDILKELLKKVHLLEKRIKLATYDTIKDLNNDKELSPSLSKMNLIFESWVNQYSNEDINWVIELRKYSKSDLIILAKEKGLSVNNKTNRERLYNLLISRVKESAMIRS
jgi:hypothetical protein